MRIVIDLQSLQGISRNRGIGRYSLNLTHAIISKYKDYHNIFILLNSNFPKSIESIRCKFEGIIPKENIKIYDVPKGISGHCYDKSAWKVDAAEKIREHFLASLSPDIVYISSPFEGWIDDIPISVGKLNHNYLNVATLYDLIPYVYPEYYITNDTRSFIFKKMQYLKQTDLLITISDYTSQEAIELLGIPSNRVLNCSVGINNIFRPIIINDKKGKLLKLNIYKEFIFYIGGIDFRKNVRGLIESFTLLPKNLRQKHQLVIILTVNTDTLSYYFDSLQAEFKFNTDEIVFLNYVDENQLILLYNTCSIFVFPSFYEGFGLPIIEAMACGACVISSNTSSMPEALGCSEGLFDPSHPRLIANKITEVLSNKKLQHLLKKNNEIHIKKFTWENTAKKVMDAIEELHGNQKKEKIKNEKFPYYKKKLAYVSPLPNEKTGIAQYSAKLIPELACYYEIVLITNQIHVEDNWLSRNFPIKDSQWFLNHADQFDIILYQFGNSHFHHFMFDLLSKYPGIVTLHDFFLSGLFHWSATCIPELKDSFYLELFNSHGYAGLIYHSEMGRDESIKKYPCNFSILNSSLGIIAHSKHNVNLASKWYGKKASNKFKLVPPPHLTRKSSILEKKTFKKKLGFKEEDFLICSFGSIDSTKLNNRSISASLNLLQSEKNCYLIFVGETCPTNYYNSLLDQISKAKLKKNIIFTGFVKNSIFKDYLISTDIAVQLRTDSRGETSASLLDCLSHGVPTIANEHGSFEEINSNVLIKLKDNFCDFELEQLILTLYKEESIRKKIHLTSIDYIEKNHHPRKVASQYFDAIEDFYKNDNNYKELHLTKNISSNFAFANTKDLIEVANSICLNRTSINYPQLLFDISLFIDKEKINLINFQIYKDILIKFLNNPPEQFRIEIIYYNYDKRKYLYATNLILELLNLEIKLFRNEDLEINSDDILLILDVNSDDISDRQPILEMYHAKGLQHYLFISHKFFPRLLLDDNINSKLQDNFVKLSSTLDGIIFLDELNLIEINKFLSIFSKKIKKIINIGYIDTLSETKLNEKIIQLILHKKWIKQWSRSNHYLKSDDIFQSPVNREIYIANKKYKIEGEIRYLNYAGNPFDPILTSVFQVFCKENSQAIDLGANIGLTTIALANVCSKGKVIAFEPLPYTFNLLKKNIQRSNLKNISIHNIGVGNKTKKAMMQTNGNFLASAYVADTYKQQGNISSVSVNIKPLDLIFLELKLDRIDFIKMDLEGYELFALEGAKNILERYKPIVYLEMNHWCLNVFNRISLPEFQERLYKIFPYIYAIEPTESLPFLDFTHAENFHHIAHEHLINFKFSNLIAGFDNIQLIQNISSILIDN